MTKRILRSIIDLGGVSAEHLRDNYFQLCDSRLEFASDSDQAISKFVKEFYQEFNASPSYQTVVDHFDDKNEFAVQERLKEIKEAESYIGTQYKRLIANLYEKQKDNKLDLLLKDVARIKTQGLKVGKQTKKGVREAVTHFLSNAEDLLRTDGNEKLSGNIFEEGAEVIAEYHKGVANPQLGRLTGLEFIDDVCKGLRPGELMLCLGYVGHCKSTFSLNYAYNQAVYYGWNVQYWSLEMMRPQIRRLIYAMHSSHPKFVDHPAAPLDYRKIRDYTLNKEELDLYLQIVKDLNEVCEYTRKDGYHVKYGKILIESPATEVTIPEIKLKAELENAKDELGLLIIDHAGLVENTTGRSVDNYTTSANYVIKDAAKLAVNFADGRGIPVFMPFQANRQGWREAEKNDGHYKLDALSYANEAEKSASVIIYVYLDDNLRDLGELKIGCLKNRDNPFFQQTNARIHWGPRRLTNLLTKSSDDTIEDLEL